MIYILFFASLLSCAFLPCEASMDQTIYIYAGPGTSKTSLTQTACAIKPCLGSKYQLEYISSEQIINDNWEAQAALLIIPGGADIPYTEALNGAGNQKIRSYVEKGGAYLGICAGSYYAGKYVDFAKGTDLEVLGDRELSFFPGVVRGPFLATYDYKSESGARAAKIVWNESSAFPKDTNFFVYCNGGGYFVDAQKYHQTAVLVSYDVGKEFAAIIECQVGFGKAILSGVHFEYDPFTLDGDDAYLQRFTPILKENNTKRLELVNHLLQRLNINAKCLKTLRQTATVND